MHSSFFREHQPMTVLILLYDSYMSWWSTRFISLKVYVEFSILDFISFLLEFMILLNKKHGLFDFKTP